MKKVSITIQQQACDQESLRPQDRGGVLDYATLVLIQANVPSGLDQVGAICRGSIKYICSDSSCVVLKKTIN